MQMSAGKKSLPEQWLPVTTTADHHFSSGLNSTSGGELKLYLNWKKNTFNNHWRIPGVSRDMHLPGAPISFIFTQFPTKK